jgi:hypothetical protein
VLGERRDQALLCETARPQLEDQRPHLGERATAKFADLGELAGDHLMSSLASLLQGALGDDRAGEGTQLISVPVILRTTPGHGLRHSRIRSRGGGATMRDMESTVMEALGLAGDFDPWGDAPEPPLSLRTGASR